MVLCRMPHVGHLFFWYAIAATPARSTDLMHSKSSRHGNAAVMVEAIGDPHEHSGASTTSPLPVSSAPKSQGDDEWVFTPVYEEPTPPPLIWGRPDQIREWRLQHGLPSNHESNSAALRSHMAKESSAHFGGWDPCLFASKENPQCLGRVQENAINHAHYERRRDMILLLVVLVVLLSIGFEKGHELLIDMLQETGDDHLVKMVDALMKELTVLGFISLLGCLLCRSGQNEKWSIEWFGHPPKELGHGHSLLEHSSIHDVRAGHCISELTVLFESIDYLIFWVMIALIVVAGLNMGFLFLRTKAWRTAEAVVRSCNGQNVPAIAQLVKLCEKAKKDRNFVNERMYERQIKYLLHKTEFLHPAGHHPPQNVNESSFSFYEYLKYCCAESVTEHIEIPSWIYYIVLVLLIAMRPLYSWQGGHAVWLFVTFSMTHAVIVWVIFRKLVWIQTQLVPQAEKIHHKAAGHHMDHDALLDLKPVNSMEVKTYKRGIWLRMKLCGTCSPSPHEQLFWFHRRGPAFINNSLRFLSFILAIFLGEWLNHLTSFPYTWQEHYWSIPVILIMCGTSVATSQDSIVKAVAVSSTELMPRHDVIKHINHRRSRERQRYHKDLLDNVKIQAVQRNVFVTLSSGHKDWIARYNKLPMEVQRRIHKTWTCFDSDNSGTIDRMELDACLHSLGKHGAFIHGASKWLKALNADEYGEGLSQQQFCVMMVAMHEAQHAPLRKPDAIAFLAGIARGKTWEEECQQEAEQDQVTAKEDEETLYDVEQVSKLLFNKEMIDHIHEVVGVAEDFPSIDFLHCVRERTAFYQGRKSQDEGEGLSATVSQIVAYLSQVDSEMHPEHRSRPRSTSEDQKDRGGATREAEELNDDFKQPEME
eukprot:gnl/MRDRNA2_/MRDRNA2_103664_c0_seq1.p1 gnl/MRDRNA2_/MRDRNA2_103664_c0~~gnl/MRDRNA2_/MRDRNA2_103664_c0_seq1.p1  ORF type:complete len:873 (-),score=126.68 gnl/MRDRNA2_/MRDRNA2_103664_c0_seq1:52-2670(-)